MLARVVRRPHRLGKGRSEGLPLMTEMATDGVRRAWYLPRPTNWKKPSCAASAANLNKRAWPARGTRSPCSRSCAGRKKWGGMTLALAVRGRSTKSVTGRRKVGRRQKRRCQQRLLRLAHRSERHLSGFTLRLFLPVREQRCVVLRDVRPCVHAELLRGYVDPARRTFDLAKVTDRCFVHDDLALAIGPLGAEFFVAE